jgi:hypothetical protein
MFAGRDTLLLTDNLSVKFERLKGTTTVLHLYRLGKLLRSFENASQVCEYLSKRNTLNECKTGPQVWEEYESSPVEFFHSEILKLFHNFRTRQIRLKTDKSTVEITGTTLNDILSRAKRATYRKYPNQELHKPIPKTEM